MLKVFLSNKIEFLSHALSDFLASNSSSLFSPRLVAIPCRSSKTYLQYHLSKQQQSLIACEFLFIEKAFKKILQVLNLPTSSLQFLSDSWELPLLIEQIIEQVLSNKNALSPEKQKIFSHLIAIIDKEQGAPPIENLCLELAALFRLYNLHGETFLRDPSLIPENQLWQYELFTLLHNQLKIQPTCLLPGVITKQVQQLPKEEKCSLAIYCFNFFPKPYLEICKALSSLIDINIYLLSPSMKFWGDNMSDRELRYLIRQEGLAGEANSSEDIDTLLYNRNSLLGNLGKIGRQWLKHLEDEPSYTAYFTNPSVIDHSEYSSLIDRESYEEEGQKASLLSHIQHDILLLRQEKRGCPISISPSDTSIEIHYCPNKLREVEVMHQRLLDYISTMHSTQDWQQAILIMAPDISSYQVYIDKVFKESEHPLKYHFSEIPPKKQSLSQAFKDLIELSKNRCSINSLLQFFKNPIVSKKLNIDKHMLALLKDAFQHSEILWGLDKSQQQLFLKDHFNQDIPQHLLTGSLLDTLINKLKSFAHPLSNIDAFFNPRNLSSSTLESPLLGQLILIIENLSEDLKPLYSQEKQSLEFWTSCLCQLIDSYFLLDENVSSQEEVKSLYDLVKLPLTHNRDLGNHQVSFSSISTYLLQQLNKETMNRNQQGFGTIQCCSLMPLRSIPSQAIFILGINEDCFPRKEVSSALNLLKQIKGCDFFPQKMDQDCYLFLETLLCARDKLYFSSTACSKEDGMEKASPLLIDLIDYIDLNYSVEGHPVTSNIIHVHPASKLDPQYFTSPSLMKNFETLLQDHYSTMISSNITRSSLKGKPSTPEENYNLQDLAQLSKKPLTLFYKKNWDTNFKEELQKTSQPHDGLSLNNLEKYWLKQLSNEDLPTRWNQIKQHAKLSNSPLSLTTLRKFESLEESRDSSLSSFNLSTDDLFKLYIHPSFNEAQRLEDRYIAAPLASLKTTKEQLYFEGNFPCCYEEGLVFFEKLSVESLAKNLPLILASSLVDHDKARLSKGKHLFVESNKIFEIKDSDAKNLMEKYIQYYQKACETPSILYPSIVKSLFKQDEASFKNTFDQLLQMHMDNFSSPDVFWTFRNFPTLFNYKLTLETWGETYFKELQTFFEHLEVKQEKANELQSI
ncbi:MAG: hypothetical protein GWP59_03925 [Chlamydiales bacterium]|nr:hypothetical protein [Chlamydiales bacterium]